MGIPLAMEANSVGSSWADVTMKSDSDDDDENDDIFNRSYKRQKRSNSPPKIIDKRVNKRPSSRPSAGASGSRSREKYGEKSIYSQFSKQEKEKAHHLVFRSVDSDYLELLKDLLELGVDVDIRNEEKATPLWLAIEEDRTLEMISLLMTPSVIGTRYQQNLTPLHRAAMKGDDRLVLMMLNKIRDKTTPLPAIDQTSEEHRTEQVRSQRDKSGHSAYEIVNKKNKYGWTALHYAADSGCVNVLQVLLMEKECDVAMTTKLKQTSFHFAARKGHLLCLKLLFTAAECSQSLMSLPKVDKNGWDIACHASAQSDCSVMKWLMDHMSNYGADIECHTNKESTPLSIACEYQKTEMFKLLLSQSDDCTQQTKDGKGLLHIAACHDSYEMAEMVVKEIPVDQQDQYGDTALHLAYKWGSTRVQQLLIDNGADQSVLNEKGEKPVDVAYQKFKIPKEIERRGKEAIAKYITDLRKGKVKMPRCKLMILGEAGVGKTSLLSLLTGEPFNPIHNETEGVDTDFVSTSKICSVTWKKKAMEGDEEYKEVAAKQLAKMLPDKEQPVKHKKKKPYIPTHSALKQQFELLVRKYTKQKEYSAAAPFKLKPKQTRSSNSYHQLAPPLSRSHPVHRPAMFPSSANVMLSESIDHHPPPIIPQETSRSTPKPPPATTPSIPKPTTRRQNTKRRQEEDTSPSQQEPSHITTTDPDRTQAEIMHRAVKLKKSNSSNSQIDLPLKFSSFDFAGQKHYKPMHHCFLTSRAVYVVAFNVRHLLEVNDKQVNQCIQELKFWVKSIHIYTDDDAKIVLVGTHRGPYAGNQGNDQLAALTKDQKETICEIMEKNFDKDCFASRLSWFETEEGDDSIIAMVESSIRGKDDSGVNVIRKMLLKLGDQYPGNKDDLPISYLRLEHKIFEERKQNDLVSHEEVVMWAREFGIDDPTVALTFFHDIGTIIDPSKLPTIFVKEKPSVLKDKVLLAPQWLADSMKDVVSIKRSDDRYDPKSIRRLYHEGIVDEKILSVAWEKQLNKETEAFQLISTFLQAYGLIIPVGEQQPQQYYIPSQLPSHSEKMKTSTDDCNKVHISFDHDDSFFPPFVLHRLMFKMYSDSDKGKDCCFLSTKCFIESLHECQWWLCQNHEVIEVCIRITNPSVRTILPAMQYLNHSLSTILKGLKAVKYTLGPVAKCVTCKEEKLLEYNGAKCVTCTEEKLLEYNGAKCVTCKEEKSLEYKSAKCVTCKEEKSLESIHLKCSKCAHLEAIDITTTAIKSKTYTTTFTQFFGEIKKFSEEVQKQLERKFKRKEKMDNDELTWNEVIAEWHEKYEEDPWPRVVLALQYDETNDDIIKEIKKDKIFMCQHIDQ